VRVSRIGGVRLTRTPRSAVLLLVLLLALGGPVGTATAVGPDDGPHRVLVTYAAPVSAASEAAALPGARAVAAAHVDRSAVQVLEFDRTHDLQYSLRVLRDRADVVSIEADPLLLPTWELHGTSDLDLRAGDGEVSLAGSALTADLELDSTDAVAEMPPSWGVANDGSAIGRAPGRAGIDIGLRAAQPLADGRDVVVAVIDSGVDIDHPLLRDRIWTNPGERADGQDTDGNGFVDDLHGWNFAHDNNVLYDGPDYDGHGTHVAGIIAGRAVPSIGFEGVAPAARIMPLKFIHGPEGRGSDAVAAIRYAIANGADVINASWGSPGASTALRTVIAESPIPIVAAAGNDSSCLDTHAWYPARYDLDNLLTVGSVSHDGTLSSFSNHSQRHVKVAAPGRWIVSTWPEARLSLASGTSMAAPFATGVVALALQHHPDRTAAEVVDAVAQSVRPLDTLSATAAGGLVRAPAVLDHLGTRVSACPDVDPDALAFADVSATSPHRAPVACLLDRGITNGVSASAFGSSRDLTRAQIASLMARGLEEAGVRLPAPRRSSFSDVPLDSTHRAAIEALAAVGIVQGVTPTSYEPQAVTTRAELAAVVARAAEYLADGEVRAVGPGFVDTAGVADEVWIDKAAGLRIVQGRTEERFEPSVPVRRDQAASMIARLLDRWVQHGVLDVS